MKTMYALLIIDLQKAYFRNEALEKERLRLVRNTNELIEIARSHQIPVYAITTEHKTDGSTWTLNMHEDEKGYLFTGTKDVELLDGVKLGHVSSIVKTRDSAFVFTDLAVRLRSRNVTDLIVAGVSTHTCVGQTAADAYAENFRVVLATDAIASHAPKYDSLMLDMLTGEYRQKVASNVEIIRLLADL